jgi:hypothetical protein
MNEVQQAPEGGDDGDGIESQLPWIDDDAPIEAAMNRWESALPRGWQRLLRETVVKLYAVCGSTRRDASLAAMKVDARGDELRFLVDCGDRVLQGIVRKASARSRVTCTDCGRIGRLRELCGDRQQVLCPRCAAPQVLRRHVDDLLDTAPFLIRLALHVDETQIPKLLLSGFREAADEALHPQVDRELARMSPTRFDQWVRSWRVMRAALPAGRISLQVGRE